MPSRTRDITQPIGKATTIQPTKIGRMRRGRTRPTGPIETASAPAAAAKNRLLRTNACQQASPAKNRIHSPANCRSVRSVGENGMSDQRIGSPYAKPEKGSGTFLQSSRPLFQARLLIQLELSQVLAPLHSRTFFP